MKWKICENKTAKGIVGSMALAAFSLFVNGFGIYLTIQAGIGAGPWDVFNIGLSKSLGILYGNASIAVSLTILLIDILLKEPIGIAMFIDAVVVGKSVDFFNMLHVAEPPASLPLAILMMTVGLFIIAYTQFTYMIAALGCGPRDTMLVGLVRRLYKFPIAAISIGILSLATLIGWLLGGPVGIGTLICAFCTGPIMQFSFKSVKFDPTEVKHQRLNESFAVFAAALKK